jgi:hypothetical protein
MTNTGLARLAALKDLAALDVRYSRVTGSGVEGLRASLPQCKVAVVGATALAAGGAAHPLGHGDQAVAEWVRKLAARLSW